MKVIKSIEDIFSLKEDDKNITISSNIPLDNLPDTIENLIIKNNTHELNNLPYKLKKLKLDFGFINKQLDFLPENLESLSIGLKLNFNNSIENLPRNLKNLKIINFSQNSQIKINIPPNLKNLNYSAYYLNFDLNELPDSIEVLQINILKSGLYETGICEKINNFPSNLKLLILNEYNYDLDNLPESLEYLGLDKFSGKIKYPSNLKYLDLCEAATDGVILSSLPPNLKSFYYGMENNTSLKNFKNKVIHENKNIVNEKNCFEQLFSIFKNKKEENTMSISKTIDSESNVIYYPDSLEEMYFGVYFNQPIDELPSNLKILGLECCDDFNYPLENLPASLEKIIISKYNKSKYLKHCVLKKKYPNLKIEYCDWNNDDFRSQFYNNRDFYNKLYLNFH